MNEKKTPRIRFKGFTDDWEQRKLGELYTERNERGNRSLQILSVSIHTGVSDGELDVDNLGKFIRRSEDKSTYKHVHSGDLIFNMMRAWQGAIGVAKTEGMISPAYISAIPSEDIYPPFMNYLLRRKNVINQINNLSYGVTDFRKRLYWNSFVQVNCKLPSVEEQRNITDVFEKIDNLITLHQRKYEKLQIIKKSMLENCFPKNGEKVPKIRFSGFTGDWEQRKLADVAEIIGGGTPSTSNPDYWDGDIDWYAPAEIGEQIFAYGSVRKITKEGLIHSSAKILPAHKTVLFTSRAGIGNMAILKRPAATNQGFQSLVCHDDIDPYFMFSMGDSIKAKAERVAAGSTFAEISGKKLGELEFMFPDTGEQKAIGVYFKNLDHLITLHQSELEKLQKIKKSMLERMFV